MGRTLLAAVLSLSALFALGEGGKYVYDRANPDACAINPLSLGGTTQAASQSLKAPDGVSFEALVAAGGPQRLVTIILTGAPYPQPETHDISIEDMPQTFPVDGQYNLLVRDDGGTVTTTCVSAQDSAH